MRSAVGSDDINPRAAEPEGQGSVPAQVLSDAGIDCLATGHRLCCSS
jgi:hypothetical protein